MDRILLIHKFNLISLAEWLNEWADYAQSFHFALVIPHSHARIHYKEKIFLSGKNAFDTDFFFPQKLLDSSRGAENDTFIGGKQFPTLNFCH